MDPSLANDIAQLVEVAGVVFEAAQKPCHWPQFPGSWTWRISVRQVWSIGPDVEAGQSHTATFFQARPTLDNRCDGVPWRLTAGATMILHATSQFRRKHRRFFG